MTYATIYYVKQTGKLAIGPNAGVTVHYHETDIRDALTVADAIEWAKARQRMYLPDGTVELWSRQYNQDKGKFVHQFIKTFSK